MYDVFISYKRKNDQCQKDEVFALNLYQKLKDQGVNCFLDQQSLENGLWNKQLGVNIWNAKFFIMIMTPHYFQSDPCEKEYHLALTIHSKKISIIPILLEPCNFQNLFDTCAVNPLISIFEHIDFTHEDQHEQAYEKLCQCILGKNHFHQESLSHDPVDNTPLWKHYPCLINRHPQYDFFFDKVKEQLLSTKKHAICIFHGNDNDYLEGFCDCIHHYHWTQKKYSDNLIYRYIDIPESANDPRTYEDLMTRVYQVDSTSYEALYKEIQQINQPVLISSEIQIDVYSKDLSLFAERIRNFVHFWESIPVSYTNNILMTCLFIVYTHHASPKKQGWFCFKNRSRKSIKDAMIEHLKDNYHDYLADEMSEINYDHIRKWINQLVINFNAGDREYFNDIETHIKEHGLVPMKELRYSTPMKTLLHTLKNNKSRS